MCMLANSMKHCGTRATPGVRSGRTGRQPNGNATPIWNNMAIAPVGWRKPSQDAAKFGNAAPQPAAGAGMRMCLLANSLKHFKTGDTVMPWSDAQHAQHDVQACWTCKHGKTWDGYSLHIRADRCWGWIRRHSVSAAHVHASQQFEALWDPSNTGRSVWADRASAKRLRDADLEQHGDRAWIVEKAKPGSC